MSQLFHYLRGGEVFADAVPSPTTEVLPGVLWGSVDGLFTPSYWVALYRECAGGPQEAQRHRLGDTLWEETAACILGGHGIPAEVGLAAFERLRERGLLTRTSPAIGELRDALGEPLLVGGKPVRYRFRDQKARYLAMASTTFHERPPPQRDAAALRGYLLGLAGIGPKTSAWIVRNWLGSSEVAILDIHIVRAGLLMGLYKTTDRVARDYLEMERRFLAFATAVGVPAADLDALIWQQMRAAPRTVAQFLSAKFGSPARDLRDSRPTTPNQLPLL